MRAFDRLGDLMYVLAEWNVFSSNSNYTFVSLELTADPLSPYTHQALNG